MSRRNPVTTITLTEDAKTKILAKTKMFGGSVASFASYWASTLAELPDGDLREIQMLVDAKIQRRKGTEVKI